MPIYKYKTFEDADKSLWNFHPDEAYYKQVAALWRFANQLSSITYPQGIFKFRNIEEANRHRDEFELAHAKRMQTRKRVIIEGTLDSSARGFGPVGVSEENPSK